jgi:uncharacterized membrane protein YsdA (DUF1294 family)
VNCAIIILLFAVLNVIVLAMYGIDKYNAFKGKWRTPEKTLIGAGAIAPWGAIIGMNLFNHKTRKAKFKVVYLFAVTHIAIILYLYYGL